MNATNIYNKMMHSGYAKYEDDLAKDKLKFLTQYNAENKLSTTFIKRQEAVIKYGAANKKYKLKESLDNP